MNTYKVWMRQTAYYAVMVEAETEEDAIDSAEHLSGSVELPKPYEYSPLVATMVDLAHATPHISKKREDILKRRGFRR